MDRVISGEQKLKKQLKFLGAFGFWSDGKTKRLVGLLYSDFPQCDEYGEQNLKNTKGFGHLVYWSALMAKPFGHSNF